MAVGAPPDSMYPDGQNWGFPPQLPGVAERSGFALWRDIVRRCGRYASLLRVDHVLGVHRLWWIPSGMAPGEGVYVRYPRSKLLAVIAAEAAGTGTTVVGENLGTVPVEITEAMEAWKMLGLYAEQTRLTADELPVIPARTVAGLRTHDMEPFAMLYERGDLAGYQTKSRRVLGRRVGSIRSTICSKAPSIAWRRPTPTSSTPISTICSARQRRTTSLAKCCRRSGADGCASRRRRH